MPVFKYKGKYGFYIHIPKTGGESVIQYLKNAGCDVGFHNDYPDISWADAKLLYNDLEYVGSVQHITKEVVENAFNLSHFKWIVGFIRNPTERILSEYYSKKLLLPFNIWLRGVYDEYQINPNLFDNHLRPQTDFLLPRAQLLKFPDFTKFREEAHNKMGIEMEDFPHKNSSKSEEYTQMQSPNDSSLRLLEDWYKDDYKLWESLK